MQLPDSKELVTTVMGQREMVDTANPGCKFVFNRNEAVCSPHR